MVVVRLRGGRRFGLAVVSQLSIIAIAERPDCHQFGLVGRPQEWVQRCRLVLISNAMLLGPVIFGSVWLVVIEAAVFELVVPGISQ